MPINQRKTLHTKNSVILFLTLTIFVDSVTPSLDNSDSQI